MDRSNLANLLQRAPANCRAQVRLFVAGVEGWPQEVPDPYFGGEQGFEQVLDMLEARCRAAGVAVAVGDSDAVAAPEALEDSAEEALYRRTHDA